MKRALRSRVLALSCQQILLMSILLAAPISHSATYFDERAAGETQALEALIGTYRIETLNGIESIVIDDIVFPLDRISTLGFSGTRWTNGIFVFQFDPGVNAFQRSQFVAACAWWEQVADIRCRERTTESVYYTIYSGSANWSNVGMFRGQMQIFNWGILGIIAHEIAHALGTHHEQSRRDRNQYVFVNEVNVQPAQLHNFAIEPSSVVYTPYDFDSIMHYGSCDFSVNANCFAEPDPLLARKTIVPRACDPSIEQRIGQRTQLSVLDAEGMARRYGRAISMLFNFERNAVCGVEVLSEEQVNSICQDGGENCGMQAKSYDAVEDHRFRGCDDGFFPPLGNCPVGKEQFDWFHREGARCGILQLNHIQHYRWRCGCPVFTVNSSCATSENGLSTDSMDRFLESTFPDEIAIGRLAAMTTRKVEKGRMEPDIIPSLAMLLEVHGTHQKYDRVLNRARRRLGFKIFLRRIFLGGRAVTFDDALEVMMGAG